MTSSCMDGLTTCMQCWYNYVAVWNQISLINKMAHLTNSLTFKYYNPLLWQIMAINMISHIIHGNITNFWSEKITIQIYAPIPDRFLIIFKFDGNFILLPCELQWSDCNKKFTNGTTALVSWHVQNVVAIWYHAENYPFAILDMHKLPNAYSGHHRASAGWSRDYHARCPINIRSLNPL